MGTRRSNKQPSKRSKAAKKMSLSEFLAQLKALRGVTWRIEDNSIRCRGRSSCVRNYTEMCPITAVAAEHGFDFHVQDAYWAAAKIGINHHNYLDRIVAAADYECPANPSVNRLRDQLFDAVGLSKC